MNPINVEEKLKDLKLALPPAPGLGGVYTQVREFGTNMFYVSGCVPNIPGGEIFSGKVGKEYTLEDGQRAAKMATLNMLAVMKKNIGDLRKIKRIVKLLCFVASDNDFYKQPAVANAASELLVAIFGAEVGMGARSAVGVNVLPDNIPFEIELLGELY